MDHTDLLHAPARAKTKVEHKRAIHAATSAAGKAIVAAELARHGLGTAECAGPARLRLLLYPHS